MQVMTTSTGAPAKPLRADAERNRKLIIEVAAQVFAEKGLDAGFDEIARRAGVGAGTVYRRFPDRDDLIEALLEHTMGKLTALAEEALANEDAWAGLSHLFHAGVRMQLDDRGLQQMLKTTGKWADRGAEAKAQLLPRLRLLLDRAKAQGRIRQDLELTDLGMLMTMVSAVHHPDLPDVWERYLTILLDGLQQQRSAPTVLPAEAPSEALLEGHFKHQEQQARQAACD